MSALPEQASSGPGRGTGLGVDGQGRHEDRPGGKLGLRERKKARTRAAIREHALRLFREQGYDATTVEQIAEAAEVSPSTFFRYFPTKEDVVLRDDMELLWIDALRAQPPGLSPLAALRASLQEGLASFSADDMEKIRETTYFALSVPAVRARMLDEFARTMEIMATAIGERAHRDPGDFEVRTLVGAALGVAMSTWFAADGDMERFMNEYGRALDFLLAGLPL
jgi:AcrR family transcriptional regulator